jgi:hypothetical protein
MGVGRYVAAICVAFGLIASSSAAAHEGKHNVRGHVADGPPCGVHGPNDCRFDTWGFMNLGGGGGNCGGWYSNDYGIGDTTCETRYLHGNDGFTGHASFGWRPNPAGGIEITLSVHGRQEALKGVTPSRASARLDSCVRAHDWAHGSSGNVWVSRQHGAPGSFDGPLYIDVRARHSGRQDPGDQPEVHIYGWLHRSAHSAAPCPN